MLFSLGISFTSWDVISAKEFVGLENYKNLFQDPLFFKSLKVTLYYTLLSVPLITCIPLLIAVLLNSKVKGISVFRAIFYVPSIVPIVASAAVWMYIYNPMYGLLNSILKALGMHSQNFIFSETGAVPSLAVMALWGAGNTVVIYLAGLQGVSRQLYEAAEIDGAEYNGSHDDANYFLQFCNGNYQLHADFHTGLYYDRRRTGQCDIVLFPDGLPDCI